MQSIAYKPQNLNRSGAAQETVGVKTGRFRNMIQMFEPKKLQKQVGNFKQYIKMSDRTYVLGDSGTWYRSYLVGGKDRTERRRLDYQFRKKQVKERLAALNA